MVWFDTDPGIDDAIALLWLYNNKDKVDLRGISTVTGNFSIDVVTKNALALSQYMKSDVPIYQGASVRLSKNPFPRNEKLCIAAHGQDGLANIGLPHSFKFSCQICTGSSYRNS